MKNSKVVSIEWYKIKTNHLSVVNDISLARRRRKNIKLTSNTKPRSNNLLAFNNLELKEG